MSSKAFLFLALLAAVVLLISSEVAARDLAETSSEKNNGEVASETTGFDDAKYDGYGGGGGYGEPGWRGGYGEPGWRGGSGEPGWGGGYGEPGWRGGYGGPGGRGGYGGYGGGGGYGERCAFGCCQSDYYGGGCRRCCSRPGQAARAETQTDPHN